MVKILVSEPLDDSCPSSPKRLASFIWRVLLLILPLGFEFELLTVVALAIEGRLSSPKNIGSGESLAPVRAVSGRNDGETGSLPGSSSKKAPEAVPPVGGVGLSIAQGAMSALGTPEVLILDGVGIFLLAAFIHSNSRL